MINFFDIKNEGNITDHRYMAPFLMDIYDETEKIHSFNKGGEHQSKAAEKHRNYEALIDKINKYGMKEEEERDLKKLHHLTLGNLYLRKGQCEEELFIESKGSYKKAVELLREFENSDVKERKETLNLLIHLSLGKYFRNLGQSENRSNFYLAINEFEKVTRWLEEGEAPLDRQQSQIWLDAQINIGRAQKNLYDFEKAEECFSRMIAELKDKVSGDKKYSLRKGKHLLPNVEKSENETRVYGRMETSQNIFDSFLLKSLMQLAIVYRKERRYAKAEKICDIVLKMNPDNIEAKNNLGVCLRKNGEYEAAIHVFRPLMEKGNRFAEIEYWKCVLRQKERANGPVDASETKIEQFLARKEPDRELRLLQGRFLQVQGKMKKAYRVFSELYEKYPYVAQGTIGLKAYYNMATCLMRKEKYQQARRILDEILNACDNDDRLARIDLGWCMMKMNQYVSAKKVYQEILGIKADATVEELEQWRDHSNLSTYERVRQLNNMGECYLCTKEIKKAECMFERVLDKEEKTNIEALCFLAQCYMLEGKTLEGEENYAEAQKKYEQAIEKLKKAIEYCKSVAPDKEEKIPIVSNLIIAHAAYIRIIEGKKTGRTEEEDLRVRTYRAYMESSLLYYPEVAYSQKGCYEIAKYLMEKEQEIKQAKKEEEDEGMLMLYRAFSRIQLWKKEEGYQAFSHFLKLHDIMSLGASKRGKILAWLFLIYREVIRIKEECRYSPDASCEKVMIPVHYTTFEVLKKLMPEQQKGEGKTGKMRLWNSVYMNDPCEGACFLDLLKSGRRNAIDAEQVGEEKGYLQDEERIQNILTQYFPHLNNDEEHLSPVNSNIYITSLSRQKDDFLMWVTYADKARGCNIAFADDFFDIRSRIEGPLGSPVYSDWDYPLYQVQYIDENKLRKGEIEIVSWGAEKVKRIKKSVCSLWNYMEELQEWLEQNKEKNPKLTKKQGIKESSCEAVCSFVADALNEVRFLFKYSEYAQEEEMRLVRRSYKPRFDENFAIPRMYTEVDRDIQIEEVKIGAKVSPEETDEIVSWLYATGRVKNVTKSGRHYK